MFPRGRGVPRPLPLAVINPFLVLLHDLLHLGMTDELGARSARRICREETHSFFFAREANLGSVNFLVKRCFSQILSSTFPPLIIQSIFVA